MSKTPGLLLLLALGASPALPSVQARLLHERVLLATGGTWESNLVAVSTDAGLVIVDTYDTPAATAGALKAVRERFGERPVRYLINTHGHDDHAWGNELLADSPIIAHRATWAYMAARREELGPFFTGQRIRDLEAELASAAGGSRDGAAALRERLASARQAHAKWGAVEITLPTLALDGGATLRVGGTAIEILYLGEAHTRGDLVVWLPEARILVVGDLVARKNALPSLDGERGDAIGWLAALRELRDRFGESAAAVVAGHGDSFGFERLVAAERDLAYLVGEVRAARDRGWTLEQARERLALEALRERVDYDELRESSVEAVWQSLGRRSELAGGVP